jgi:PAS domain S-box-containing protein
MSQAYDEAPDLERLRREVKELREKGNYYQSILESADKGIWVIDSNYKTVYINYRMAEMLGTAIDKVMGGTVWKFMDEANWHNFINMVSRCKEGCLDQIDIMFHRADGRVLWTLASLAPFFDMQGFRVGVSGTFVDITERKRMETALKETRDNLMKAQHVGRMGSWVRDLKTDMIESSGEIGEILGIEAVPTKVDDIIKFIYSPDERERFRRIVQEGIEKTGSYKIDVRMMRPDGRDIYCHLEAEVVKDGSGRPVKVVGVLQDITERKKAELELRESRAQSEFFIDLISHNMGNMNHALLGYLELALEKLMPGEYNRELLAKPIEIIKDSGRLINDVRKLRQVVSGEISVKKMDISSILAETVAEVPKEKERDIRINFAPRSGCTVMANELLKDAYSRVIENSIRHSSGPLTINVNLAEAQENGQGYCRVELADNGPGIPGEIKRTLLLDFNEPGNNFTRIGFGLRFVKTLVDSYHGKIWLEDRVPGEYEKGLRVVITIPKAE